MLIDAELVKHFLGFTEKYGSLTSPQNAIIESYPEPV
jgi:hypothetical protein